MKEPVTIEYPDPDFSDFGQYRMQDRLQCGQIWAVYDMTDAMPRLYILIKKVFSAGLNLQVTWLEPHTDYGESKFLQKGLSMSCGLFKQGESELITDLHVLSHIACWGKRSLYKIYPKKGETWALFRNWDVILNSCSEINIEYEIVEVLADNINSHHSEDIGSVVVAPLVKVKGFTCVFNRDEQEKPFLIPSKELFRFSHRVPSFPMTGKEGEGVPEGSFELDPASVPNCIKINPLTAAVSPEANVDLNGTSGEIKTEEDELACLSVRLSKTVGSCSCKHDNSEQLFLEAEFFDQLNKVTLPEKLELMEESSARECVQTKTDKFGGKRTRQNQPDGEPLNKKVLRVGLEESADDPLLVIEELFDSTILNEIDGDKANKNFLMSSVAAILQGNEMMKRCSAAEKKEDELEALKQRNSELENVMKEHEELEKELREKNDRSCKNIAELEEKIRELETKEEKFDALAELKNSELESAMKKHEELQEKNDQSTQKISELEEKIEELNRQNENREITIAELEKKEKRKAKMMEEKLEALKLKNTELLETATKKYEALDRQLQEMNDQSAEKIAEFEQKIEELEQLNKEHEGTITELGKMEEELEGSKLRNSDLEKRLQEANDRSSKIVVELEEKLAAKCAALKQLKEEIVSCEDVRRAAICTILHKYAE